MSVLDSFSRPLGSLRISVTDRCNLRCRYCMPEDEYVWLPRESILTFEETARLAGVFASLGVSKVRLTGGEPLLRQDLPRLVELLRRDAGLEDLAMTTNGVLLARHAARLKEAGLDRLTISLDTLDPQRFRDFARGMHIHHVLAGIDAARAAGFSGTKLNTVVIRGFNDDEIEGLLRLGRDRGVEVRFIEYMDVGGATRWSLDDVVPKHEILERVERVFGRVRIAAGQDPRAPAERFLLPDDTTFGIIASVSEPFCATCNRSRLTADGLWYLCLYAGDGVDLKEPLRRGASDDDLREMIRARWTVRRDRGAEERLNEPARGPLYQVEGLRADPHREMHTRGG